MASTFRPAICDWWRYWSFCVWMPELAGSGALLQSKGCTYSIRNHAVLTGTQGEDPQWAPSSPSLPYFCHKVKVSALDAAIRNWKIAQIPSGAKDLDQLVREQDLAKADPIHHRRWLRVRCQCQAKVGRTGCGDQPGLLCHR